MPTEEIAHEIVQQIENKRKQYRTDSYSMSLGELASMYSKGELIVNPAFQRYFRWTNTQKTKLIESILLGIPIPQIFVYQKKEGQWEVVDGLQRISTILQLMGELIQEWPENAEPIKYEKLFLEKTKYLPALENMVWENPSAGQSALPENVKLFIKRAKINLTIILPDSDDDAKYEVFQRLNTGGTFASPQELRNCLLVMLNEERFKWLKSLADNDNFRNCISLNQRLLDEQYHLELVLKFITCVSYTYDRTKDVKDNIDLTVESILNAQDDSLTEIATVFEKVFYLLNLELKENSFQKYNLTEGTFKGKFLESAFEAVSTGLGLNIESYTETDLQVITEKVQGLWVQEDFLSNIGGGSNAKTRVPRLITFSRTYFSK